MMSVQKPEDLHAAFAHAASAGDLHGLMALYEPEAALVPQAGQAAVTGAAMQEALRAILALTPTVECSTDRILRAGDVAFLRSSWRLSGTAPDGQPVTMAGRGVEVARRQVDGSWRFLIDDPFGGC